MLRALDRAKFAPLGDRSIAGGLPHLQFRTFPATETIGALNEATMVLIMIELAEALAEVDAIAAVEGVDCCSSVRMISVPRWASRVSSTTTWFGAPMPRRWTHAGNTESTWASAG